MASVPMLLRRRGRRGFRRLVYLSAVIAMLSVPPNGAGLPSVDNTPPVITPVISRGTLGANGWYISDITLRWDVSDPESGIVSESPECNVWSLSIDTAAPGITRTCTATNGEGWTATISKSFKLDKTPPSIRTVLERQADANGWYNRPFSVSFAGTDATSGVSLCTSSRYAGPDSASALVSGSCSDYAGLVTPTTFAFKYDATAPSLLAVTAARGNRSVQVAWRKSVDTSIVEVVRAPGSNGQGEAVVYRGSNAGFRDRGLTPGRAYEYRVIGSDEAANRTEHKFNLVATGPLLSPFPGAKVTGPPALAWTAVRRASYYNIQLIRNGRRVLSAWPDRPSFRLRRTWLYRGRRYRLRPGVYRWYVWPGFGRISAARYARRPLGSSSFVVTG